MSAEDDEMPAVPEVVLALDLRGLRSYVARAGDGLVLVVKEDGPGGDGAVVTFEPGVSATLQAAVDGAEELARTAAHYAELLRVKAGNYRPMQAR